MRARNIIRIASLVILISISLPAMSTIIVSDSTQTSGPAKTEEARGQQLVQRLTEIRDMDKSELTRSEKRDLRKEVKGIRKEMREGSKGIYLSVGAIIIIILLLILIL
jgi:uncharacterized protein YjaG (DUF416 family)